MPRRAVAVVTVAVLAAVAVASVIAMRSTPPDRAEPSPVAEAPASPTGPARGVWNQPATIDGHTITITEPIDATDNYPCTGCRSGVLLVTVTLVAGPDGIGTDALSTEVVDGNYSIIGMTALVEAHIPPGGRRVGEVQIHPDVANRKGPITVTITGATAAVEWHQESRP